MIGDDAMTCTFHIGRSNASRLLHSADQRLEEIGLVIVMNALKNGGHALKAQARIDRRLGKIDPFIRRHLLELLDDPLRRQDGKVVLL